MGTLRTTVAVILTGLAMTAFHADISAQTRNTRGTGSSSAQTGRQVSRSASSASRPSSVSRPSTSSRPASEARPASGTSGTSSRRPSTTVTPPSRPSAAASSSSDRNNARPASGHQRPAASPSDRSRPSARPANPSGNASRPAVRPPVQTSGPSARPSEPSARPSAPSARPSGPRPGNGRGPEAAGNRPAVRPDRPAPIHPGRRPEVHRVHPRDREFMHYSRPSYFWTAHGHCYGHRVRVLPTHVHRHVHHGITYYCHNDIWYRPYGGYYVVCRPPFGTVLAAGLIADMTWSAVRFSYYNTVANAYSRINENNEYIAQQNELIARNNALIAEQNKKIAENRNLAGESYGLADALGLVQSYAAAGTDYYYQDGVFYVKDSKGEYKVILPPAGALVESLPEDYDMVTLNGDEYYKVDDTVYRVTINDGKPYFEVLGQLYA